MHTATTEREKSSPYIYTQNGLDVSVYYLYGMPMPHSERFYPVECFVKKTGIRVGL